MSHSSRSDSPPAGPPRTESCAHVTPLASPFVATLAERLGFGPDDRLLILSSDLLGSCHAANEGVYESLRQGVATTASLMVPAPWARHAAAEYRGEDVGVHLTVNAELDTYRWGPITHAPSLLDGDGGVPPHRGRHVGPRRTRRDPARMPRPDRAGILWGFT